MRAVWAYLRRDLRRRAAAWIVLALFLGVVAGASLTAMAGARRANSAYPRFLRSHNSSDVSTGGLPGSVNIDDALTAVESLPQVTDANRLRIVLGRARIHGRVFSLPDFFGFAAGRDNEVAQLDTPKLLQGRLADPGSASEVVTIFGTARNLGLRVGDRMSVILGNPFSPGGPEVPVRVVGIIAVPGGFDGVSGAAPSGVVLTKAFLDRYAGSLIPPDTGDFYFSQIKLKHGTADIPSFVNALKKTPYADMDMQFTAAHTADVQKALHPYSVALWLLGGITALIALLIGGQLLARHIALSSEDYPALRALGIGRRELLVIGLMRALAIAAVAAPLCILTAFLLSPLTPIGDARIAEPSPGLAFDASVMLLGALALVVLAMLLSAIPAWRVTGYAVTGPAPSGSERPSLVAGAAAGVSASAPAVTGLRMALEPGKGRAAVPVATTILSVTVALAALAATTVFAASLQHMIDTPALTGFTYDALAIPAEESSEIARVRATDIVRTSPYVAAYTQGNIGNASVGGRDIFVLALRPQHGIGFSPISGRAPTSAMVNRAAEIAVGPTTLRRQHWHIGQTVTFPLILDAGPKSVRSVIVGTSAMPAVPFRQDEPGDGIVMTLDSYSSIAPDAVRGDPCCFVRFKSGVDPLDAREQLQKQGMQVFLRSNHGDLNALTKLTQLPTMMAYIIFVTAGFILGYALVTAISRRRRDLAILKVFGFVRRQVRQTVAWQATALAFMATAFAIPIGLIVGRYAWRAFAGQFGVVPQPVVPVLFIVILLPVVLLLANLIAVVPARAAARAEAAVVLRTE